MGVVDLLSYFMNRGIHPFSGVLGLIVLLVGVWIYLRPETIASLVPIVIGVILAVHGLQDFKLAFENKTNGYPKWWTMLIVALISMTFGIICIVCAFGVAKLALQFIGIALVYDGISDLWIVTKTLRTAKKLKEGSDALDVDYKEV